ncbi:restriction endonuclease subunit S [Prevotella sp.]|uniref:restriction endonuclease subunit S n=1 Tax=Prevotella sp. TaxID=59823 RepID=UPI0030770B1B
MTTKINNEHKKLNVPNLRFKEFQGEWKESTIGEMFDLYSGNTPSRLNKEHFKGTVNWISSGELKEHYIYSSKEQISEEAAKSLKLLPVGTFVIAIYGLEAEGVRGTGSIIQEPSTISQACMSFIPKGVIENEFLYSWYKKHGNVIGIRYAQGTKQQNLSYDILEKFMIVYPNTKEQEKLNKFISLLDERITTQNKIIEDLKKLKCAIIEKHYRQAKLHKYKICDLGVPFSVGSLSKEDLSEEGHECILYGELFTTYDCVINEVKSHTNKIANTTLSQKGDLLFPSSTTVDAVSLISPSVIDTPNVILGGDMFGIHIDKKFNAYYLSYYINLIARKKLAIYAKGSTIIHLHYKDIAKAQLLLPDLCEQDKIAKCMMAEDAKINVEEQLLTKLEKQKQYLLRQMFI